ncbi:MAG: hypothetical protein QGI45_03410 [Myxococcota bacterium]|jgi:hypothetical protein|nr:hypothetical protein [Myxococcota bacterium]
MLSFIQAYLQGLNGVELDLSVEQFLVDKHTRGFIPGCQKDLPEQMFIREMNDETELALYIEPGILSHLHGDQPFECLHTGNIKETCVVVEGISHFILVVWRAHVGRPVSALELEIQAEVDKFICSWFWLIDQGHSIEESALQIFDVFFTSFALHDAVPVQEHERYWIAHRTAKRFCRHLLKSHKKHNRTWVNHQARRFFRLGLSEKLRAA